jgi:hypothetical protein
LRRNFTLTPQQHRWASDTGERMIKKVDAKVTNLLLDTENPRLTEGQRSQAETIHAILRAEGPKTLALAQTIANEGLSPMERLIVIAAPSDPGFFVVLEGNRRVTALKMLAEPAVAEAVLKPVQLKNLRKWSAAYGKRGEIVTAECVLFPTREDADVWIERRHRGDQGGVGVVRWGATESARFDARRTGKRSPELQVLDFVAERGNLDQATRDKLHDVSITNLKRLIRDESVRDVIGITLSPDGQVSTALPEQEALKGLTRIVGDLANERLKVSEIYEAKNRKDYLSRFRKSELPSRGAVKSSSRPLMGPSSAEDSGGGAAAGGKRYTKVPRPRATLVPGTCACAVRGAKLVNIYSELRRLRLEDFPNSAGVLFRVFLELSVDAVIEQQKLMSESQARGSKLRDKISKVADHLASSGKLSDKQVRAVKKTASSQHFISGSVTTLHEYVHNTNFSPSPADLRAAWDNSQVFLEAIWTT